MLELYKRIRERRESLGMSQEELAKKLGYKSRSSINKIELGENDIPQSKIVSFANALQTTPAYLMGWDTDTAEGIEAALKDILVRTGHLSPSDSLDSQKAKKYLSILGAIIQAEEESK